MSFAKDGRKNRPFSGKTFRGDTEHTPLGASRFAAEISSALRHDFGDTHAAVKIVAGFTGANERAVKNWFSAKNGPSGAFLILLCRHSERVMELVILQAGRPEMLKLKRITDLKATVRKMLVELEEIS